jgi:hypothetical protein
MQQLKASNAAKLGILVRTRVKMHGRINVLVWSVMIKAIMIVARINAKANKMAARKHAILNIKTGNFQG